MSNSTVGNKTQHNKITEHKNS